MSQDQEHGEPTRAPRRPAILDVARKAGVSRAAVSKVIRNAYGVSPEMRARVNAAIEELGYRPSSAARALRGASFTIGMEMPFVGNPFLSSIMAGAVAELEGTGYQLVVAPAELNATEGLRAIEALADRGVDGIVTVSPLVETEWLERLAARAPVVMIGRHDTTDLYDTVTSNDREGARLVMDHLLGLGHRNIAHLTRSEAVTRQGTGSPHSLRLDAYRDAMNAAGLSSSISVLRGGPTEEEARALVLPILRDSRRPTAIFAANDELALGAQRAALELGVGPSQLSIVGYDDVAVAGHPAIALTTVAQPGYAMGRRAVELVRERLDGRTRAVHHQFDVTLQVRGSSAPPVSSGLPESAAQAPT
jgi:LacI family transcriptional regulator